jgi:hypothetical protein
MPYAAMLIPKLDLAILEFQLSNGTGGVRYGLVDLEDYYEIVQGRKWNLGDGRYINSNGIRLHRYIMNVIGRIDVDHINGNKLDNRRSNLRLATRGQNNVNSNCPRHNTSGAKGVSWDRSRSKWFSKITCNGKQIPLGRYDDFNKAVEAYNNAAIKYFGEFARINEPK